MDEENKDYLKLDNVSIFWMKVKNNDCFGDIAIYTIDILTKELITTEVKEVKQGPMIIF